MGLIGDEKNADDDNASTLHQNVSKQTLALLMKCVYFIYTFIYTELLQT